VPGGEHVVEDPDAVAGVGQPGLGGGEAGIVEQVGAADGFAEVLEVPLDLDAREVDEAVVPEVARRYRAAAMPPARNAPADRSPIAGPGYPCTKSIGGSPVPSSV
jgi:hypothetical protein